MGFFDLGGVFDNIIDALDQTKLDHDKIEQARKQLGEAAKLIEKNRFADAAVAVPRFGGSDEGQQLGIHHGRAQQVIEETLGGILKDLDMFSVNVKKAAKLVEDVDTDASTTLKAKADQIASAVLYQSSHSAGDHANDNARNHPWTPGSGHQPSHSGGKR